MLRYRDIECIKIIYLFKVCFLCLQQLFFEEKHHFLDIPARRHTEHNADRLTTNFDIRTDKTEKLILNRYKRP